MFFFEGLRRLGELPENIRLSALSAYEHLNFEAFTRTEPVLSGASRCVFLGELAVLNSEAAKAVDVSAAMTVIEHLRLNFCPLLTFFGGEINYLLPGAKLRYHVDPRWFHVYGKKLLVPIKTSRSSFISRGRNFPLELSKVYEIDNVSYHSGENLGNEPRISINAVFLDGGMVAHEHKKNRSIMRQYLVNVLSTT